MRPLLDDAAVLEDDDQVGVLRAPQRAPKRSFAPPGLYRVPAAEPSLECAEVV
jgi:hypothetical protein